VLTDDLRVAAAVPTQSRWEANQSRLSTSRLRRAVEHGFHKFEPLLMAAIDQRLGSPYRWGATGPTASTVQDLCGAFTRRRHQLRESERRNLFARFEPAPVEEQFKFGTLVFFSGLTHVGVVADEHGFYHASAATVLSIKSLPSIG
jgi:cell wall-associated NlpC family hydrolase